MTWRHGGGRGAMGKSLMVEGLGGCVGLDQPCGPYGY